MSAALESNKVRVVCEWLGGVGPAAFHVGDVTFNFGSKKTDYCVCLPSRLPQDSESKLSFHCSSKTSPHSSSEHDSIEVTLNKLNRLTLTAHYFNATGSLIQTLPVLFYQAGARHVSKFEDVDETFAKKPKAGETIEIFLTCNTELAITAFISNPSGPESVPTEDVEAEPATVSREADTADLPDENATQLERFLEIVFLTEKDSDVQDYGQKLIKKIVKKIHPDALSNLMEQFEALKGLDKASQIEMALSPCSDVIGAESFKSLESINQDVVHLSRCLEFFFLGEANIDQLAHGRDVIQGIVEEMDPAILSTLMIKLRTLEASNSATKKDDAIAACVDVIGIAAINAIASNTSSA